jgi:spermidine synthase
MRMNRFEKILSYLYPINIETVSSDLNPILEVVFRDGRYQLNSANANYSYGGLQELFVQVFKTVPIDWKLVNDVLILGFGVGCTVPLILNKKPECKILGVEIDEKVIDLGRKYFGIDKLENTRVVCDSAQNYLANSNRQYDLIIIDVYIDSIVPEELETLEFLKNIKSSLSQNGIVIFNKLLYSKKVKEDIVRLEFLYREVFEAVKLYRIMDTGQIFVAVNKTN